MSGGAPTGKWPTLPPHLEQKAEHKGAKLFVRRPNLPEVEILLEKKEFVIGRDTTGVDLTLDDDLVSRKHASLTFDEKGYYRLTDMGSKNGIRYAERTVRRLNLVDGDEFAIGKASFLFKAEMARFQQPPPPVGAGLPKEDSVFAEVAIPRPKAIPDPAENDKDGEGSEDEEA